MNTLEDYCAQHTSAPDKVLNDIYRSIALHTANPHMSSTPYQGMLLHMLTLLASPTLAVEVGSFAGYGAICIARGMRPGGTLHVIEANEEYGDDRMAETLTALNGKSCKEIVDGQLESVRAFAGEAEQSDDITILALKRKA